MIDFTAGVDCQNENEWCLYMEPHKHGSFACDSTCLCDTAGRPLPATEGDRQ